MSEAFDPYYKWLGIPTNKRPVNDYRLLGIELFESDPDVISNASDQRIAHIRTYQAGKHAAVCQKILNEISAARVCLLNPETKNAYDAALRQGLRSKRKRPRPITSQKVKEEAERAAKHRPPEGVLPTITPLPRPRSHSYETRFPVPVPPPVEPPPQIIVRDTSAPANASPLYGSPQQINIYTAAGREGASGTSIAGLVCGILALVVSFLPCIWYIAIVLGAAGVTCSIVGLATSQSKGMALAGLICSSAAIILVAVVLLLLVAALSAAGSAPL